MRHPHAISSPPVESRGAAAVTIAFAALVIGVGTVLVTSATAAPVGQPDNPTDIVVLADQSVTEVP